jgi:vacuolar-type H+-ATPase subunit C/Vma6
MEAVLSGWDAYNLKTVLRGKKAAAPIEEILASTFPVGVLDEIALGELVRAPTLKAVADILETWRNPLARPLAKGLRALGETNSLQSLEFELDRFVYAQALSMVKNGDDDDLIAKRYIQLLGDKTNLLSALRYLEERSALSPLEAVRYFLEADGRFTRKHFQLVVTARDLRQGLSLLAGTPYGWLAEAFPQGEAVSVTKVERKLDSILLAEAKRLARYNPLGVGVTLAYLVQKINEVRNIRLILRAKVIGMSTEQLTEWLAIPAA